MKKREGVATILIIFLALISVYVVVQGDLAPFGNFPQRPSEENLDNYEQALTYYGVSKEGIFKIVEGRPDNFGKQSISVDILSRFSQETGAANAVTAILWDYRGYDTLGEATVIFVAVASVAALFRASKKEGENE